ncbi:GntR family transcriptional regulator [Virgibacillus profundi]|uniref:GntR family transcriptional regulator n=1 Tax=Virgibacillus profundi TaxID=2024555 RepID=A0A2A2IH64_9BACI|nr:PLP-dependent aminotransferase family protein [Virgibacillus profundi]PAV30872.1 GntR family transcriptional regulator [Virgibacillus profundi]PXY55055.1 PLP-dependent aminotransferase family protein [Virgibacillus profundi]
MDMFVCNLDRENGIPLYEQLYACIKTEIMEGRISYGIKLPSKRKLAEFLKISQNTVEQSYDQLAAEGYIEGIARKGYFVLANEDLEYVQPNRLQNDTKKKKQKIRYNFHPSQIDTENFPFAKWRKYAKNIIDKENQSLLLMGDRQGEFVLREEIANYLYQARGVHCSPDDIIIGAGVETLLQQLILLLGNKATYGVEDPGYHVISRILKNYPNKVYPLNVDEKGVKVDSLDGSTIDMVYVTPTHHFPYGSVLSANRRIKLLNWASSRDDRYIIEDDYDSEFRYTGKSIPSLQSMDHNEKVIYLGTFSKSLIPSIRISYMVLPKRLMKSYKDELSFFQCSVSRMDQHILAQFMNAGDFEKHLNRMRKVYRRKMEKTLELLKPYQQIAEVVGDLSGFHVVLKVKNNMCEEELVNRALKSDIKIYPLSSYVMENQYESQPIIILGFAGIPEAELAEAIGLLLKSWGN